MTALPNAAWRGDKIALYGDIRVAASIGFYTHRHLWLYNASNSNLEYGSHYPDAPKVFLTDVDFPSFWKWGSASVPVVPNSQSEDALKRLPRNSTWVLAKVGGKTLYSNRRGGYVRQKLRIVLRDDAAGFVDRENDGWIDSGPPPAYRKAVPRAQDTGPA